MQRWREWAAALKRDVKVLALAVPDPRVPWPAKVIAAATVAYALSPIDLIPDFVPVLGLLDDLILVPLGVWATLRLVPPELIAELRRDALTAVSPGWARAGLVIVLAIWLIAGVSAVLIWRSYR